MCVGEDVDSRAVSIADVHVTVDATSVFLVEPVHPAIVLRGSERERARERERVRARTSASRGAPQDFAEDSQSGLSQSGLSFEIPNNLSGV